MEGPTTKRDFREKRKSGDVWRSGGVGVPLDFLQFQHDFGSFSDKKGLLLGGPKPFSGRANTGAGEALAPPVYMSERF